MAETIADLLVKIGADISGMKKGFTDAEASLANFGQQTTAAGVGLVKLGAPLTALGVLAANTAGDFEASMNILAVAAGDSGASLEELRNVAIRAGADVTLVGVSAADVALAMTNMTKAGVSTSDMLGDMQGYLDGTAQMGGALRAAIDLAAASELDLDQASRLVVTTMNTFGLSADEVVGAMSNYVQAADASVASVSDLRDAMENVGPSMASFGFSLGEVNTALALLSTRGITGSEAGTALKSIFVNLMRDTPSVTGTLDALNVSLYNMDGTMRAMPEIIADLSTAMAGMTEEQKNQTIQTLAGSYGMKAMATLLAEGKTGWDEMTVAIGSAATMQESADARTKGFNAALEQLKSTIETFMINAGTPLIENVLTPLARKFTEIVGGLAEMDPQWVTLAIAVGGAATVLGTVLVIAGQIATAISALMPVFAVVGAAIGAISLPVVALGAAVAALALAWNNNWFGIRDTLTAVWDENIRPALEDLGRWLADNTPAAIGRLNAGFNELIQALAAVWNFINQYILPLFNSLVSVSTAIGDVVRNVLVGAFQNLLLPALQDIWGFVQYSILPAFDGLLKVIGPPLAGPLEFLANLWKGLQLSLSYIPQILTDMTTWFNNLGNTIRALKLPDWLTPGSPTPFELALLGILDALKKVAGGPWEWFNEFVKFVTGGRGSSSSGPTYNFNVNVAAGAVVVYGNAGPGVGDEIGLGIARALAALIKAEETAGAAASGAYPPPWQF